jgi:hypothetical protein
MSIMSNEMTERGWGVAHTRKATKVNMMYNEMTGGGAHTRKATKVNMMSNEMTGRHTRERQ